MELQITTDNFEQEVLQSDKPVLIDFYADWCGPCKMQAPVVEEIANEHPEFKVGKLNVDEQPDLAVKYRVMSIPTLLVFKNGEMVKQAIGLQDKQTILNMLQ